MKFSPCAAMGLVAFVTANATASGDHSSNPYLSIARQNVFRLQPALRVETRQVQALPPPKIILLGIVCIREQKQVLFKSVTAGGPGEPAREFADILAEGESHGGIVVCEINKLAGTVRFNNHGQEQWLGLETDSAKPKPTPAAPPMPFAASELGTRFKGEGHQPLPRPPQADAPASFIERSQNKTE